MYYRPNTTQIGHSKAISSMHTHVCERYRLLLTIIGAGLVLKIVEHAVSETVGGCREVIADAGVHRVVISCRADDIRPMSVVMLRTDP